MMDKLQGYNVSFFEVGVNGDWFNNDIRCQRLKISREMSI